MAKVCIICYKERDGKLVADDFVIRTIRAIKQKTGTAKNNTLVVCPDCMETHKKKREKYERDLVMHVAIAGIVLLVFVLLPIFTTGFSLAAIGLGLALAALVMGFSTFSHHPKLAAQAQMPPAKAIAKKKKTDFSQKEKWSLFREAKKRK